MSECAISKKAVWHVVKQYAAAVGLKGEGFSIVAGIEIIDCSKRRLRIDSVRFEMPWDEQVNLLKGPRGWGGPKRDFYLFGNLRYRSEDVVNAAIGVGRYLVRDDRRIQGLLLGSIETCPPLAQFARSVAARTMGGFH